MIRTELTAPRLGVMALALGLMTLAACDNNPAAATDPAGQAPEATPTPTPTPEATPTPTPATTSARLDGPPELLGLVRTAGVLLFGLGVGLLLEERALRRRRRPPKR